MNSIFGKVALKSLMDNLFGISPQNVQSHSYSDASSWGLGGYVVQVDAQELVKGQLSKFETGKKSYKEGVTVYF